MLAADTISRGHLTRHHRLEITDDNENLIGTVRFDEVVEIRS